jgi:ABC-type branched-subunit amino acid transport system ATPase component
VKPQQGVHDPILEVRGLGKSFAGILAIADLSFSVRRGSIKAVIGPNGAGKTTLYNLVTGIHPPTKGQIVFKEQVITGLKPHQIATLGISRTFQTVELFPNMTVLENVMVGRHRRTRSGFLSSGLTLPAARNEERDTMDRAMAILRSVDLEPQADDLAGSLPLGAQKLLEIGRALAVDPELILLDEPAAGLNESETARQAELILRIRSEGKTVIVVEHDMKMIMDISDEIVVLNYGQKIAEGSPQSIREDAGVIEAYLGEEIDYAQG